MLGILLILFVFLSLPSLASPCIDFWGEGCGVKEKEVKEKKKVERDVKVSPPKLSKKELLEKLFKESLNWTPDNLSPLERYVATHPEDTEALRYLRRYIITRKVRACYIEAGLIGESFEKCERMREELLKALQSSAKKRRFKNYEFLFFYSPSCPHCQKVFPVVLKELQGENLELIEANSNNAEIYEEWGVTTVPTLIAVNRKKKKAYRLRGFNEKALQYFLNSLLSKDTSVDVDRGEEKGYKEK